MTTILKNIDMILTEPQRSFGFTLREEDDDFLHLYLGKIRVATFGQQIPAEGIHKEVNSQIKTIIAYHTTNRFIEDSSEYCREQGWKEAR